ncbi:MAG TPA: TIM barrel protein, partial [Vicinamibacteria bacterium]|nr:TIM barrel protein [Vicinamibacteria bacterium]
DLFSGHFGDVEDDSQFLKVAGGAAAAAAAAGGAGPAAAAPAREEKLKRLASNCWSVRHLFKQRSSARPPTPPPGMTEEQRRRREQFQQEREAWKKKYGEITLLDFPQFTRDTYPGVTKMDLFSGHFGDVEDDSQFLKAEVSGEGRRGEFDPSQPSSKKYLDRLAEAIAKTGVRAAHISNNAPRNLADLDEAKRRGGVQVAKHWLDGARQIGAISMRCNTGGPRIIPAAQIDPELGYPMNKEVVPHLRKAIESFRELAEHGEKVGVKVTIENHWGLAADPMNIWIIIREVASPYCEASPDFCNWEHEYLLYHGLEVLAPLSSSMVHAKRWTRFPDVDIARCVRIMTNAGYRGYFAVEFEEQSDGVEGSKKIMEEVLAAL